MASHKEQLHSRSNARRRVDRIYQWRRTDKYVVCIITSHEQSMNSLLNIMSILLLHLYALYG